MILGRPAGAQQANTSPRPGQRLVASARAAGLSDRLVVLGISPTCAYRWWARYRQTGPAGLVDRPSRAHHHPHQVPTAVEAEICRLRQAHKLGPARIAARVGRPASTVHRVLVRHQLNCLAVLDHPSGAAIRRYERAHPGELVHLDVKKLGRLRPGGATASTAATRPSTALATGALGPATTMCMPPSTTIPGWPTPKSWLTSGARPAPGSCAELAGSLPATASPSSEC
jgi:hypothetical protein